MNTAAFICLMGFNKTIYSDYFGLFKLFFDVTYLLCHASSKPFMFQKAIYFLQ